jgi:hypothetical protein
LNLTAVVREELLVAPAEGLIRAEADDHRGPTVCRWRAKRD